MIQPTSLTAYDEVKHTLGHRHAQVLELLATHPAGLTAREIARALGLELHCVSGRIRELVERGQAKDAGRQRQDPISGHRGIVWILTPPQGQLELDL